MALVTNQKYEVLTPDGWSNFVGIQKKISKQIVKIVLDNNEIRCTKNHLLKTEVEWKTAKELNIGDKVQTINGFGTVQQIHDQEPENVYDLLEVHKKNQYYTNGILSHNCAFIGSSNTLLSPEILIEMKENVKVPIYQENDFTIYEEPKAGHRYCITVDPSRGQGLDYTVVMIIDVTNLPFKQVGMFRSNKIYPTILPNVIHKAGEKYNWAHVLIEINDIGAQVADMLIGDLDYENVIRVSSRPGVGQTIGLGIGSKIQNGVKTSPATKRIGCADLRSLIENHKLEIVDETTINEFFTFVSDTQSYAAEEGNNDDTCMSLVLFGWLSHQRYFREEEKDIREGLQKAHEEYLDQQLVPFGIFDDGTENFSYDYENQKISSFTSFGTW